MNYPLKMNYISVLSDYYFGRKTIEEKIYVEKKHPNMELIMSNGHLISMLPNDVVDIVAPMTLEYDDKGSYYYLDNKKRHGEYIKCISPGNFTRTMWKNGLKLWKEKIQSALRKYTQYKNGIKLFEKHYYDNGQIARSCHFKVINGKLELDGWEEEWYDNGVKKFQTYWLEGQMSGVSEGKYKDGDQRFKYYYRNGKKHGVQYDYEEYDFTSKKDCISSIYRNGETLKYHYPRSKSPDISMPDWN